jgi:hypothetical protein
MAVAAVQVPGVQRRQAGDVIVTALKDGFIILPPEALQGIGVEERDAFHRAAGRPIRRPSAATSCRGAAEPYSSTPAAARSWGLISASCERT